MEPSGEDFLSGLVGNLSDHQYVGDPIPALAKLFFITLGIFLMISGTLGNILVLVTLAKCPSLHSLHYVYVANLAVADLIIEGYSSPFVMYDLMLGYHPVINRTHCVFNGFLVVTCYVSSLLTLASISFNRYMNVCQNAIYNRYVTRRLTLGLLVLVWVISATVAAGPLVGWGRYGYDAKTHYCGYDRTASISYTILIAAGTIGAPATAVCYFNYSIFSYVRQARRTLYQWKRGPCGEEQEKCDESTNVLAGSDGQNSLPQIASHGNKETLEVKRSLIDADKCFLSNYNTLHTMANPEYENRMPQNFKRPSDLDGNNQNTNTVGLSGYTVEGKKRSCKSEYGRDSIGHVDVSSIACFNPNEDGYQSRKEFQEAEEDTGVIKKRKVLNACQMYDRVYDGPTLHCEQGQVDSFTGNSTNVLNLDLDVNGVSTIQSAMENHHFLSTCKCLSAEDLHLSMAQEESYSSRVPRSIHARPDIDTGQIQVLPQAIMDQNTPVCLNYQRGTNKYLQKGPSNEQGAIERLSVSNSSTSKKVLNLNTQCHQLEIRDESREQTYPQFSPSRENYTKHSPSQTPLVSVIEVSSDISTTPETSTSHASDNQACVNVGSRRNKRLRSSSLRPGSLKLKRQQDCVAQKKAASQNASKFSSAVSSRLRRLSSRPDRSPRSADVSRSTDVSNASSKLVGERCCQSPSQQSPGLGSTLSESTTPTGVTVKTQQRRHKLQPLGRKNLSMIRTLFIVFVCMAVFMSPYMVTIIADVHDRWPALVHCTCSYLAVVNNAVNWMLYGMLNAGFRAGYRHVIFEQSFTRKRKYRFPVNRL